MWTIRVVAREILFNLWADGWRAMLVALVGAGLLFTVAIGEFHAGVSALQTRDALVEGGKYVFVVESPPASTDVSQMLDASRCLALEFRPHVLLAGGFDLGDPIVLARAPNVPLELARTVGSIGELWDVGYQPTGNTPVLVGAGVAEMLSVEQGVALGAEGQPISVTGVFHPIPRFPSANAWLGVSMDPSNQISECWIEFHPGAASAGSETLRAWFESAGLHVSVRPLLVGDEYTRDPARDFAARSNRQSWIAIGSVLGLLLAVVAWFKRADIALYKSLGFGKLLVGCMYSIQGSIVLVAAAVVAGPMTVMWAVLSYGEIPIAAAMLALRIGALACLVGAALQSAIFVLTAAGATSTQLKER